MTIRDAKQGYPIYFLDRNTIQWCEDKIIEISLPHIDTNSMQLNKMVIDVRCGDGTTYTMSDSAEIAYVGTKVITTDKRLLVNELENIIMQSEKALGETDMHKDRLQKCKDLILELNPEAKEKKATDERLTKLEGTVCDIHDMLTQINCKLMTKI